MSSLFTFKRPLQSCSRAYFLLTNQRVFKPEFGTWLFLQENSGNVILEMANKLYADVRGFEIADKFNATLIASYDTTIERLNFADSERARTSINDWVQQMTRDKIRDLIPSGTLLIFILSFFIVPHDYLLLDSASNIGRLISPWELDKFKNCWNKSFKISRILALLYQQLSNLLISQRHMSGPRLGALSKNRWSGVLTD